MKRLLLILPVVMLLSFAAPGGGRFDKGGVSFTIPDGWKITEEENIEGKGYYLSCEKEGENSSGLVTVTWVNDSMDLESTAESYGEEIKKNYILKQADPSFKPLLLTSFNGMAATKIDYAVTLMNVPHEGHIYSFYGNGKTITVLIQEAVEDKAVNKAGIQEISRTLVSR
jgi:hypothetical protein